MNKGRLILYSGPSGVGKGTLRKIFSQNKKLNLGFSISYTTRKQRPNEIDKKDYFFVSEEKFQEMIDTNDLIEWVEFAQNKYGTSKSYVDSVLKSGKNIILEIETIGALRIMELYPDCLSIFLMPPSLERIRRKTSIKSYWNSWVDQTTHYKSPGRITPRRKIWLFSHKWKWCIKQQKKLKIL